MKTPATRYRSSRIAYPERLPEVVYPDGDRVLTVGWDGKVKFDGYRFRVSNALRTHKSVTYAPTHLLPMSPVYTAKQRK